MRYTIDRFKGKYAICIDDNYNRIEIEASLLPKGAGEGQFIEIADNGTIKIADDPERVKRISDKMRKIWR